MRDIRTIKKKLVDHKSMKKMLDKDLQDAELFTKKLIDDRVKV